MSGNKKYTIVVKRQRVEVSEAVYFAYHKAREAERYQNKVARHKVARHFELSLERFQEDGVHVELQFALYQPGVEDKFIAQEQLQKLKLALAALEPEEKLLIHELFFNEKSESQIACNFGMNQSTISRRLAKTLLKLKNFMKI